MTEHPAPPRVHDRALADTAFLARFTAVYRGRHEPLDALFWLQHPGSSAPSGAEDPAAALRRARIAVYRPDATDDDRRRVADLVAAVENDRAAAAAAAAAALAAAQADARTGTEHHGHGAPAVPRPPQPQTRGRAALIGVGSLAVAAAIVVAGVLVSRPVPAPRPSPAPAPIVVAQPVVYLADLPSAARARADLAALVEQGGTGGLIRFLDEHLSGVPGLLGAGSVAGGGAATGPHTFSVTASKDDDPTRPVTVLLTCSRSTAFSWTLSARGTEPLRVHGAHCHGQVVATQVLLQAGHSATALHVDVPRDVRVVAEIDVARP